MKIMKKEIIFYCCFDFYNKDMILINSVWENGATIGSKKIAQADTLYFFDRRNTPAIIKESLI